MTAYPTAGPKPLANKRRPADLPRSGGGIQSLISGTINGTIIVPHKPVKIKLIYVESILVYMFVFIADCKSYSFIHTRKLVLNKNKQKIKHLPIMAPSTMTALLSLEYATISPQVPTQRLAADHNQTLLSFNLSIRNPTDNLGNEQNEKINFTVYKVNAFVFVT